MSSPEDPPRGEPTVQVRLTGEPLDPAAVFASVTHPECGGVGLFLGVVRNHHMGEAVDHLEYEAWEEQITPRLEAVAEQVLAEHPGVRAVHLAHRVGRLDIGEPSVIVAASAPHRHEAISAATALIDRLKATVPIWKREHLADGSVRWPGDEKAAAGRDPSDGDE